MGTKNKRKEKRVLINWILIAIEIAIFILCPYEIKIGYFIVCILYMIYAAVKDYLYYKSCRTLLNCHDNIKDDLTLCKDLQDAKNTMEYSISMAICIIVGIIWAMTS